MKAEAVLAVIALYFVILFVVSALSGRRRNSPLSSVFFDGGRQSPWWVVAISMIGSSISGVTFVSVPGMVEDSQFSYMQMVLGFIAGYAVVAYVLLPLYYRYNLTTIYAYLEDRFGTVGRKTGALFFVVSKFLGCGVRMFLTASVLQLFLFDPLGIPFAVNAAVTMLVVWGYSRRGGVKTLVWVDMLQTLAMIGAVVLCLYYIARSLGLDFGGLVRTVVSSPDSRIWFFDDPLDRRYFWKQFLAGAFTVVAMTGLDQDMMQKNLSCRNLREARRNVMSYGVAFVPVNLLFLALGILLLSFRNSCGITIDGPDNLFPTIATQYMGAGVGILFILGLTAAGFSSAGSALTSLTSSVTLDLLRADRKYGTEGLDRICKRVHSGVAVAMGLAIFGFSALKGSSVIDAVYTIAGYTYGPLLGMFIFGMTSKLEPVRKMIPAVCVAAPVITFILDHNSERWFGGYQMGFEVLLVNAAVTMLGLLIVSRRPRT